MISIEIQKLQAQISNQKHEDMIQKVVINKKIKKGIVSKQAHKQSRLNKKLDKIMKQIIQIQMQKTPFELEFEFYHIIKKDIDTKTNAILLPKNDIGKKLLSDGLFIIKWCQIIKNDISRNYAQILKNIEKQIVAKIVHKKQQLIQFLKYQSLSTEIKKRSCNQLKTADSNNLDAQQNMNEKISIQKIMNLRQSAVIHPFGELFQDYNKEKENSQKQQIVDKLQKIKIISLEYFIIRGIIEYDYKNQGIFSILLGKALEINNNQEILGLLLLKPLTPEYENSYTQILKKYQVKILIKPFNNNESTFNIRGYWQKNLQTVLSKLN